MVTEPEKELYDPCGCALALDFTNTMDRGVGVPWVDTLESYADLVIWSVQAACLPTAHAHGLRMRAEREPGEAEAVLARGRELREASYRTFTALQAGEEPSAADLAAINGELAAALGHARLGPVSEGYVWSWELASGELAMPLWPVVRSIADLLTSPDHRRIKQCASGTCLWLFLDQTKNRGRRWCTMKSCGNRAKVRAHRARKRG